MTTIAVLVGSLSEGSINKKLAKALESLAPDGVKFVYPSLDLPFLDREKMDPYPKSAQAMKDTIAAADGVLFVTPEYNRSFTAPMKNALDWMSRPLGTNPLSGKPAAIIGASGGVLGTTQAQQALRNVAIFMNTILMGQPEIYLQYSAAFEEDGSIKEGSVSFLQTYVSAFLAHVEKHA